MAGYTRQSAASIVAGLSVAAAPVNAEFNQLQSAFNSVTGHGHTGGSGDGPPVVLTTSVSGSLPIANGGTAGTTQATARTGLGLVIGTDVQAYDADLAALAANVTDGFWAHTGVGTGAARTLTAPAAGFTITNPAGIAGNPTFILANDLAALEGMSGTGLAVHTATDTWLERTLTGTVAEITVTNGTGVAGNPTFSIPAAVTFTGKTITGGTYASATYTGGAFNGTLGATTPSSAVVTTLTASGAVTPQTLLDISGASAGQIKFPASQNASANVNILDDYEEGTWTPVLQFGGASVGITYSTQAGTYTKIGNVVYLGCDITLTSKGSSTGSVTISGIPFSPTLINQSLYCGQYNNFSSTTLPSAEVGSGAPTLIVPRQGGVSGNVVLDNTNFTNTSSITFGGFYFA